MYSSQNTTRIGNTTSSFTASISKSVLLTFQHSYQNKLHSLQSFQLQLKEQREMTLDKFDFQKQQLQTLIVEIAGFLDDLMLPIVEENPFFLEDFILYIENSVEQVENQLRLFTTLSLSSLRKQVAKTSQQLETKALKESFENKQKRTLAQTEKLLDNLNQQLIAIRHRIEKLKDQIFSGTYALPVIAVSASDLPSLPNLSTVTDKTISNIELIKQDIKRLFM
ncbi:hypothetical protein [Bernardetia sp.]|uniref:hypothetical protein n=1 Tax=Bernardetia sp. TaxID=1937974 RepID=UPI0025B95602|nr:hypothetical protein [Bernardetia sp.]